MSGPKLTLSPDKAAAARERLTAIAPKPRTNPRRIEVDVKDWTGRRAHVGGTLDDGEVTEGSARRALGVEEWKQQRRQT